MGASRRLFLTFAALTACKPTRTPITKPQTATTQTALEEKNNVNSCKNQRNQIQWQDYPDITENDALHPKITFYGSPNAAMVVVNLHQYSHTNLKEVYLLRPSGHLLAQKGIGNADIRPNNTLRPLSYENLELRADRHLIIVFRTTSRAEFYKYVMPQQLNLNPLYDNKPVFFPSPNSIPPNFPRQQNSFLPTNNDNYHQNQNLWLGDEDLKFQANPSLANCTIADLASRTIAKGTEFNNVHEHQKFFCYLNNGKNFFRTLIKVF